MEYIVRDKVGKFIIIIALIASISCLNAQSKDLKVIVEAHTSLTITSTEFIHYFTYTVDPASTMKLWRYMGMMDIQTREVLVTSGDSESVYRSVNAIDFTGGYHGDEELTSIHFILDGDSIKLNTNGTYYGDTLKRMLNSNMYTTQNSNGTIPKKQIECKRTHILEISEREYRYYNKWEFVRDQSTSSMFPGMYCIGTQFSNVFIGEEYFVLNQTSQSIIRDNVLQGTWKYPGRWEADLSIEYPNTPSYFVPQLLVLPTSNYNKAYFGMHKKEVVISKNDVFEAVFSVRYSRSLNSNLLLDKASSVAYPNPCSKTLKIKYINLDDKELNVYIFDFDGKEINKIRCFNTNNELQLDVSVLKNGIYYYIIEGLDVRMNGSFVKVG